MRGETKNAIGWKRWKPDDLDKIEAQREAASDRMIERDMEKRAEGDIWIKILELEQKVDDHHTAIGACLETFAKEEQAMRKRIEALEDRQAFRIVHFCRFKDCIHAQDVRINLEEMRRLYYLNAEVPTFWRCSVCMRKNAYLAPAFYLKEAEKKAKVSG